MDQGSNEKHILLQGELSCTICTHTFEDPHVLNCGHSYCGGCILEWLKANKICPLCRTPVNRRPIHIIALQKMADVIRTEEVVAERKLNAEDWIKLFPHDNQSSYIIDEDDDGIVHRCSRCGWELDEDNFCARCEIQFDGSYDPEVDIPRTRGRPAFSNTQEEPIEVASDSDNDYEDNRDLEGFVVDDDHVEYEDLDDGLTTDDTDREERSPSEHISISSTESDSDEDAEQMRHNDGYESNPIPDFNTLSTLHSDDEYDEDSSSNYLTEECYEVNDTSSNHYDTEEDEAELSHHFRQKYIDSDIDMSESNSNIYNFSSSPHYGYFDYSDDESRNIPFDEVSSNNSANSSNNIEVDNSDYDIGSDDDASHGIRSIRNNRRLKRRIVSDDEEDEEESSTDEEEEQDFISQDDEEEEQPYRKKKTSVFIDDIASEDDDEEEERNPITPAKVCPIADTINRAKNKMFIDLTENAKSSSSISNPSISLHKTPAVTSGSSSDDDDSDDSDVSADYASLGLPDNKSQNGHVSSSAKILPTTDNVQSTGINDIFNEQPSTLMPVLEHKSVTKITERKMQQQQQQQHQEHNPAPVSKLKKKKKDRKKNKLKNNTNLQKENASHVKTGKESKKRKRKHKSSKRSKKKSKIE